MSDAELNLDNVQFAEVRKLVDADFRAMADELEVAYYQNWKLGKSYDYDGWDPISDPSQGSAKEVFDMLHGAIWAQHEAAVIDTNATIANPYPEDKINPVDQNDPEGRRRRDVLADKLADYETKEALPSDSLKTQVQAKVTALRKSKEELSIDKLVS